MLQRALISVYDKRGVADFARGLAALGIEILSTGGTFRHLQEEGIAVTYVSDVTGFPEILDGRVKTLHPAIHGGILARRDREDDMRALAAAGIRPIDLVAVNLYPFSETVSRPEVTPQEAIEMIDIGGPAMVRAAAKNHAHVIVVVNPDHYETILALLRRGDGVDANFRRRLAAEAFRHTSEYDRAIWAYLEGV